MLDNVCRTIQMNMEILDLAVGVEEKYRHRHHRYQPGGIGTMMEEEGIGIITMVVEEINSTTNNIILNNSNRHLDRVGRNNNVLLHHPLPSRTRVITNVNNDSGNNFATPCHPPYPRKCACPPHHSHSSIFPYSCACANVLLSVHCDRSVSQFPTRRPIKIPTRLVSK